MGEQESQLVIDRRERWIHDLRGHEVRKDLLHPHIVEPLHRDEVAEPHVRGLVGDHAGTSQHLILCRGFLEHQAVRVVEDRARMFHAAKLEGRQEQEIELSEWIGDAGVALHPLNRRRMQVEDRLAIPRDLRRVGLAVQHPKRTALALRPFHVELSGGEGEQVGRDRLGLGELQSRTSVFGGV